MTTDENPLRNLRTVYREVKEYPTGVDAINWRLEGQVSPRDVKRCLDVLMVGDLVWCPIPNVYRRSPLYD